MVREIKVVADICSYFVEYVCPVMVYPYVKLLCGKSYVLFSTFCTRDKVNDILGGACKIMS